MWRQEADIEVEGEIEMIIWTGEYTPTKYIKNKTEQEELYVVYCT